jgi:hypothetical protein
MTVMGTTLGSNVVKIIGSHGSNRSNHEFMKLKLSHVIMKQSLVGIGSNEVVMR